MGRLSGGTSSERRAQARITVLDQGSNPLVATVGLYPRCALVVDLSPRGMGLLTVDPPPEGAVVPVWLPGKPGQGSDLLLVRVIYAVPQEQSLYRLGTELFDEGAARVVEGVLRERLQQLG